MLRVAIVGCGKIADEHAHQVRRIAGTMLVGLCDAEPLMARQMSERFEGTPWFADLDTLLSDGRPDVVHVTTPPHSHYSVAMRCLNAGCHVLVEKPFTTSTDEALDLIAAAGKRNLKITVDHNLQFTGPAMRMRALVQEGFLGGSAVHVESYHGYDLGDANYARAFLTDTVHWVRSMPGGLLQNIISHGIAKIAEHMTSECPAVTAMAFTSPFLREIGEEDLLDELRVLIKGDSTTAYFTFSSQMRPLLSQTRVFGRRHGLLVDDGQHVLIKMHGARYKSYLENFIPPLSLSSQYLASSGSNIRQFLSRRLNMNEGMKELIQRFYRAIVEGDALPIPYREIILTSRIIDAVLAQVSPLPAARVGA
jgi:predicted dehydrogenase